MLLHPGDLVDMYFEYLEGGQFSCFLQQRNVSWIFTWSDQFYFFNGG